MEAGGWDILLAVGSLGTFLAANCVAIFPRVIVCSKMLLLGGRVVVLFVC
jgi:hypothetical protein